jgi:hypothetical protein
LESLIEAGMGATADQVLDEAIDAEDSIVHVGRMWAERCAARNDVYFEKKLPALLERGAIGKEALYATVDALGKPASAARLHELVARFDAVLRRDTPRGWAKTAEALVAVNDFGVVATWVADWRTREVTEPWMLYPVALCFRITRPGRGGVSGQLQSADVGQSGCDNRRPPGVGGS